MYWLLTSIVIFIFGLLNFFSPVRGLIQNIFNPLQFGLEQFALGINDGLSFYVNLREIRDENLLLLEELEDLRSEVLRLKQTEEENVLLREQLDIELDADLNRGLILAQALGNVNDHTGTTIVLDKGSLHGASKGDFVIKGRHLIGIIKEVTQQRSEVELITSPNLSLSVIDFQTKTEGLARGDFGTSILMERILPGESINVGDLIETSGRDGRVFPGFLVGQITSISEESAEVLRTASLRVLLDVTNLGKVFIVPIQN